MLCPHCTFNSLALSNTVEIMNDEAAGCRSVYLVTYSQADKDKVEGKQEFAAMVTEEFQDCQVLQWVCCKENHEDGGEHYHLAVKLDRVKRWKMVRHRIAEKYGINVHFSGRHNNYYSAY